MIIDSFTAGACQGTQGVHGPLVGNTGFNQPCFFLQIPRDQDDELDDEYSQDGDAGSGGVDSPGPSGHGTSGGDSSGRGQVTGASPGKFLKCIKL